MDHPKSILIIKPSSLGDIVHTLPALDCIHRKWPEARLTWLINPEWAPLVAEHPALSEVIEFPRRKFAGILGWLRFPSWLRALRKRVQPDLVLDFQGLFRSAFIARCTGGKVWGTSDSREGARWFHHRIVPVPPRAAPVHAVTRALALAAALGCDTSNPRSALLPAGTAPQAAIPSRFVLLHPFSRGAEKSLSSHEVAAFCAAMEPVPVILVGRSENPVDFSAINLINATTLSELCWLIRHANFTVSVDSGPMHIAAALTERLLAIHTWSDPAQVGPFSPNAWVWKNGSISQRSSGRSQKCPRASIPQWLLRHIASMPSLG